MDFVSTALVTLNAPSGVWETILNAFRNGLGSYILAVIMIAVIVRIVFALLDIVNKKVTMKNSDINAKMKPELEAIQKKYGYDQRVLQQKTNEVYKKYQFNMMSSCLPMLIMLVLQMTVFLTLWNALQSVANFNIAEKYENMKSIYANVININTDPTILELSDFEQGDLISVEAGVNDDGENVLVLSISKDAGASYQEIGEVLFDSQLSSSNEVVYNLIGTYVTDLSSGDSQDGETTEEPAQDSEETTPVIEVPTYAPTAYSEALKIAAENAVEQYYLETQEGFLWIKNIYKSESPTSPMFTESEIKNYLSRYYSDEEQAIEDAYDLEGKIFGNVVAGIDTEALGLNGYYILTIIAVAVSFLSIWLSNKLMNGNKKNNPNQKSSWAMYVIMPVIYGIFTFMYTSLFAIYLIVGQIIMLALTPLTTWIVRKWIDHDNKKKQDKNVVEVDYRRKDV